MKMKWLAPFIVLALLLMSVGSVLADGTYTYEWDGKKGLDSEDCGKLDPPLRPATGWIHWVFNTKGDSTGAKLFLGGTGSGEYEPGPPLDANVWHFYTPFFELDGLTAEIELYGGDAGPNPALVISDYCPGECEKLEVKKTADTYFKRTHDWAIDKSVDPVKMYLYTDGSGDGKATWTVDVTYKGYEDSGFKVFGKIYVKNVGNVAAKITGIADILKLEGSDIPVDIDCGVSFPYTLAVGKTLTCEYSQDLDGKLAGKNTVKVTTEKDTYSAYAGLKWGDPKEEVNAIVDVYDTSDLFGAVKLGTLYAKDFKAGDVKTFTYEKEFKWADYGKEKCGDYVYKNTAKVVGSGDKVLDEADATLKVYVQCFIFCGETAWAANGNKPLELRYTLKGNWATYVQYASKTTTLFAGQTIPVGTVTFSSVVGGKVTITVVLTAPWEFEAMFENLKVQDYAEAPSGNPAPGLFAHKKTCDAALGTCSIVVPANNFYGVHVNVGEWIPDPNFGP
jgi:hypothetical protein